VQFPYDDHFADERRSLAAEAVRAIDAITRTTDPQPDGLEEARRMVDPDGSLLPD
jgi:hypothetical protein